MRTGSTLLTRHASDSKRAQRVSMPLISRKVFETRIERVGDGLIEISSE